MATYKVLVGVDYSGKRAEPGDIVSDLPAKSVVWLSEQNIIEPADNASVPSNTREQQSPSKGDK